MYVKYDGGTLSSVLGGHSLASVSIPSSGCPPPVTPFCSVPLPSLPKSPPLPFSEHCAPLKLGTKLSVVDQGGKLGLRLVEVSPVKYVAFEVDPSCTSGIHSLSVEPVAPCKMGIHSLGEPMAPCEMGMGPAVCCFEKGHFWKGS